MRSSATASVCDSADLTARMCLACGYRGPELQDRRHGRKAHDTVFVCPSCGEDLYARPARSYAEMEGLTPSQLPGRCSPAPRARRISVGPRIPGLGVASFRETVSACVLAISRGLRSGWRYRLRARGARR